MLGTPTITVDLSALRRVVFLNQVMKLPREREISRSPNTACHKRSVSTLVATRHFPRLDFVATTNITGIPKVFHNNFYNLCHDVEKMG